MRILLKLSGEALMGKQGVGVETSALQDVVSRVTPLKEAGHHLAIVIGGGNFFRGIQGASSLGMERSAADHIGMLATVMNGILLKQAFQQKGLPCTLLSAIDCPLVAEKYSFEKATSLLQSGQIVLFVGGTGHPYFTTDTAAALRASEIKADLLLKTTTRVDGIYDQDPLKHKEAKKFPHLTYKEFIEKKLGVMDLTAVALCMTNDIPIRVMNLYQGPLVEAVSLGSFGSLIKG